MNKILFPALLAGLFTVSPALVVNPVITTDKSVNAYSLETIAKDLVKPGMTNDQKLAALFSYQRRVMHHYRLEAVDNEDNFLITDAVRLYNIYGFSWCTQQATVFNQLCGQVFGKENARGLASQGMLASSHVMGGHSSFCMRFNKDDKWHWVDPIIGAYARTRTDGSIASMEEIAKDPLLLVDAVREKRSSMPYFPCTVPPNPIPDTLVCAYSYFDYDTAFAVDYMTGYKDNDQTTQTAYCNMRKNLKKGEVYYWLWDFLPGDYYLPSDSSHKSRSWDWYPPRHICGWKDSLDTFNWPYFKPYEKVINGATCFRYYANGIHIYEPDLKKDDPKDDLFLKKNAAFFADDGILPAVRPAKTGETSEIAWRFKLPYPLMTVEISGEYVRASESDTLLLSVAPVFFDTDSASDASGEPQAGYQDTLGTEPFRQVRLFGIAGAPARFSVDLRDLIDPANNHVASKAYGSKIRRRFIARTDSANVYYRRVYDGYVIKFTMKGAKRTVSVGLNSLRVKSVFQHNMFALPQLEPGLNRVSVTTESASLNNEDLKVGFGWMENGKKMVSVTPVKLNRAGFPLTVKQKTMPKMLYMWLGNTSKTKIDF